MKPYSVDLRERVLLDRDAGQGTQAVAFRYRVSLAWVRRRKQQRRETGQIAPRQPRPRQPVKLVEYVEKLAPLVPTLRPGDIVVMDTLQSHKVAGVRQAIAAAEASVVYLPPYSPDFNPIEQVFAKVKSILRKKAERTVDGLWSLLGQLLDSFPADECLRYFRHCGYAAT